MRKQAIGLIGESNMSQFFNEIDLIEDKKPRVKPFGLPYQAHMDQAKQAIKNHAIRRAKINDKKHKPTKEIQPERKTIHWLDYRS